MPESGFSFRKVRTTLHEAGVVMRPPIRRIEPCPDGMVNAYRRGDSIRTLATRFDLSYNVTRRRLLEAGVQLRPRGREASG
ncbi:helix-turn-helix domain-containing protein [Amycolatopsis sp. cmx-4-54]|uniref:helix-turn-helix domain-containing protein n=1 Tax=Amycolatopsis sp. cmx-4-54 TaxID=2790936 RepID=UPI00397DF253